MPPKKRARSQSVPTEQVAEISTFRLPLANEAIVWHREAHQRFHERLYYFFFKVRPLEHRKHQEALDQLMRQFGIKRYCSYSLFGSFDSLVRVWLPAPSLRAFLDAAERIIPHRLETQRFSVQKKPLCWIEAEVGNGEAIQAAAKALTALEVHAVQEKNDPEVIERLWKQGLLRWRPTSLQQGKVKAFISFFEPPDLLAEPAKEHLLKLIERRLKGRAKNPTLMEGMVFCWAFAKVVCDSYQSLCELLEELVDDLAPHLVSTRTFLVVSGLTTAEHGDSISEAAIELVNRSSDPVVAEILPELYADQNPPLEGVVKAGMIDYVHKHLLNPGLPNEEDARAIRRFLAGVARNSVEDAFVALYPRFINAEARIAGPITSQLASIFPGGGAAIANGIQERDKPPPKLNKLTLAQSLQAARHALATLMPDDARLAGLPTNRFEEIGNVRNALMHGLGFDPRSHWKRFADVALDLFVIRDSIESCYKDLEKTDKMQKAETSSSQIKL